jgi:ABC-type uncharacterized transport system permease subunit
MNAWHIVGIVAAIVSALTFAWLWAALIVSKRADEVIRRGPGNDDEVQE